jgi:hypothetical protein
LIRKLMPPIARAEALLARQALEETLDAFWISKGPAAEPTDSRPT